VVERMLCMYEAPGSIPGISRIFVHLVFTFTKVNVNTTLLLAFHAWGCSSVVERTLRMCEVPGSIPGISNNF
jgi:hypothetical protein